MKNRISGTQLLSIPITPINLPQVSFSLKAQDEYIVSQGTTMIHEKALPSAIGNVSRSSYRHSEATDSISSNGYLYRKAGEFQGMLVSMQNKGEFIDGGFFDSSSFRLLLPRFYNTETGLANGDRMHFAVGDRIFLKESVTEVCSYQKVEYSSSGVDILQFPAILIEFIVGSDGTEYKENIDYFLNKQGAIEWISGGNCPGIEQTTGLGRVYSVRFQYKAHWHVSNIISEVRICNVTEDNNRKTERMPYQLHVVREYIYFNQTNTELNDTSKNTRLAPKPVPIPQAGQPKVKVTRDSED
jgi:hypothetical protein